MYCNRYACCNDASGGYRASLWATLNGSHSNGTVVFVGTQSNGPAWVPQEQRAHEGHPGWTIDMIAGLKSTWTRLQPDIVLLKAGKNYVCQCIFKQIIASMLCHYFRLSV
jgi:hypothetical protein